jgi:manganese/iron transport system ATP-binding protein
MPETSPTSPQEPARLDIEKISVGYNGRPVVEDLSFQVPHGARLAVVGPNGAGKSTLFKALVGLLPLSSGQIFIHGLPLGHHQDCVAYVPQREEVDWRFPVTVADVVMMGRYGKLSHFDTPSHTGMRGRFSMLGWLRAPGAEDKRVVRRSLDQMGIGSLAKHPINDLSGGQQQRVFLARALAQEPHILLMDEPFTGVDISTQEATLALLDQLQKQHVTVIVSTHDLNMAAERFESCLLLNHTLVAYGPPVEALAAPNLRRAFGKQVLFLDGGVLVDECCPPDESRTHEHHSSD